MVENGRVVLGDGRVLDAASVVVAGDRIVSVTTEPIEASGIRRIDATGRTVLPGLIDTHVHLLMEELFAQPRSEIDLQTFVDERLPDRLRAFLEAGITTVFSTGDFWPYIANVRDRIRSGDLVGPRIRTAGPIITAPEGHPATTFCGVLDRGGPNPWCRAHLVEEIGTAEEARSVVAEIRREGADHLKFVYAEAGSRGDGLLDADLLRILVDAAREHGMRSYAHIMTHARALRAIDAGLDGLVHLPAIPSEAADAERLAKRMRDGNVTASTTLTIFALSAEIMAEQGNTEVAGYLSDLVAGMKATLAHLAENHADLVVLGTDSPHLSPGEAYHSEIDLVLEAGLTPEQLIRAATLGAATHMGLEDQLGTLEAGKLADVVVVDGNPLEDPSALKNVVAVVQGGVVRIASSSPRDP